MKWPIFVISLADEVQRREKLLEQCAIYGIDVEFVDAIDGRNGLPPEYETKIDRKGAFLLLGHEMSDGEFACALSHQKVYEKIIADGLPGAIILEDDAIFRPDFAEFIKGEKYRYADFIQMDYLTARYFTWTAKPFFAGVKVARSVQNAGLATAYSMSAHAAQYILSQSRPLRGLADWPCDLQPLRPLITLPELVVQPDPAIGHSTLEADRRPLREKSKPRKMKRFANRAYWRRWIVKRLSRPVN